MQKTREEMIDAVTARLAELGAEMVARYPRCADHWTPERIREIAERAVDKTQEG